MQIFAISGLVNAISALGLGLFVVLKDQKRQTNRLFFFMTLALSLWAIAYWKWLSSTDYQAALMWIRILSIGSLFIPVFYFHWIVSILNLQKENASVTTAAYLLSLIFLFYAFSDLFVADVAPKAIFLFWPVPGLLYTWYLWLFFGLVGYSLILLVLQYTRTTQREKRGQIIYILSGALLGFGGGATNFFLWYDINILPYGNFLVALFPFLLGYATIKHGLFEIKVIATELITIAIWIFLLVRALFGDTLQEQLVDGSLFALVFVFGIFLIKSVLQEVKSREQIQKLADGLNKANEELKRFDTAKSEFISIAGHQLRAPLTIIKGYTSLIQEGTIDALSGKGKEALDRIRIATEQLVKLVSDLLNLSRIESGKIKYEFKKGNFSKLIEEIANEFKINAEKKGITIAFTNSAGDLPELTFDPDKIREVVVNLVDNAIKYSKQGGDVVITEEKYQGFVRVSVKDSGMGIKPEDIPHLFIKFVRTEEAQRSDPGGMGIGLYFVKRVAEDHGGRVGVKSEGIGKGSTFWFEVFIK